ncbi:GGDEF domain-containing protein [Cellvibrio sp. KY-YJ-3]|uniref:sensor domain-containing diguanylate cyclase n=1 Tax=Cellvibrio sp. KY-YJ-3 TaxID=454662 RepID=UPI0012483B38|nr:GGDEF domain-containing protein [Cellvibrio sp. KY-YJ-3]QEY11332.1 GGDEF domain-containing protein [Cellvibrio sp. KY-YJ-3]
MTANNSDKNNWREKYLNALDEQDQLEKKFAEQQAILRSALVRVSIAADGQDEVLDRILASLREKLRGDMSTVDMSDILQQLERAALSFEQQREQGSQDVRQALMDVTKPLQQFKLSRSVKKELGDYLSQLPQRSKKVRLYPALLQQLAKIQQLALEEIEQPKTGFFERLLGAKAEPQTTAADLLADMDNPDALAQEESQAALEQHREEARVSLNIAPRAKSQVPELAPEYAEEIARVLNQFLLSLENEAAIKDKVDAIRRQVANGLAQTALIPTLEAVRDLVMEAYLAANQAFANYLKNVNQELAEIYGLLGGAVKNNQQELAASRKLQDDVMREMSDLETSANSATDINQLKDRVKSQIGNIRQAIDQYQSSDINQHQLAQQLATLGEKIKLMESEAEQNRSSLEKHRHKALHDPLTELPNREAYNERAVAEVQRWQRYQRPLTIAIFDIDYFKKINDNFGHQAGDRVIKVIGRSIAKRLREVDFFCRYGGEEFVAFMPETDAESALVVLEKLREAIAKAAFNYKNQPMSISISIGLTEFKAGDDLASAFERADKALYRAKANGRNRCELIRDIAQ